MRRLLIISSLFGLWGCGIRVQEEMTPIPKIEVKFEEKFGKGKFLSPSSIVLDKKGHIYVLDTGVDKILKFNGSKLILEFGQFGTTPGRFNSSSGVEVFENWLYVADRGNGRVQKFDLNGNFLGNLSYENPDNISMDIDGNIYICDSKNNKIAKFEHGSERTSKENTSSITFGEFGWGEGFLNNPVALALDREANIYVSDQGNSRVEKFSRRGRFLLTIKEGLNCPEGLTIDHSGNIWVCDKNKVFVFDPKGRKISEISEGMKDPIDLTLMSLSLDKAKLYVVDKEKKEILVFKVSYK